MLAAECDTALSEEHRALQVDEEIKKTERVGCVGPRDVR